MKEMTISLTITILLERTDINWLEEEVVRKREEVFKEVFGECCSPGSSRRPRDSLRFPSSSIMPWWTGSIGFWRGPGVGFSPRGWLQRRPAN